jgi:hypothetical protein
MAGFRGDDLDISTHNSQWIPEIACVTADVGVRSSTNRRSEGSAAAAQRLLLCVAKLQIMRHGLRQ